MRTSRQCIEGFVDARELKVGVTRMTYLAPC